MRYMNIILVAIALVGFSESARTQDKEFGDIPESFGKDMIYDYDPADYPSLRETFESNVGGWNSARPANFYEMLEDNSPVCATLLNALNEPYFRKEEQALGKRLSAYLTNKYSVKWQKVRPLKPGQRYYSGEYEYTEIDLNNDGKSEWATNIVTTTSNVSHESMFWVIRNPQEVYIEQFHLRDKDNVNMFFKFIYGHGGGATGVWRSWRRKYSKGPYTNYASNTIEPRCSSGDCRTLHRMLDKPGVAYPASKYDLVSVDGKNYFTRVFYSFFEKPRHMKTRHAPLKNGEKEAVLQNSPAQFVYLFVSELSGPQDGNQICAMRSRQKYRQMVDHLKRD